MRCLVVFLAIVACCYGVKDYDKGGNVRMPHSMEEATASGWVLYDKDDKHGVNWYSLDEDLSIAMAFSQKLNVFAGLRMIIFEKDIEKEYLKIYKRSEGIFEEVKYHGQKAYMSTLIFSSTGYVTENGQELKGPDSKAYLKEGGKFKMISREVCHEAMESFTEQSCKSSYGLVLSSFGKKTKCKNLTPFYAMYDPEHNGPVIGVGWITFSKVAKNSIIKALSADAAKARFPQSPACLTASPSIAVAELWFSFTKSQAALCSSNTWAAEHCKNRSHKDISLWAKLVKMFKSF